MAAISPTIDRHAAPETDARRTASWGSGALALLRRPLVAAVVLFGIYVALSFAVDPRAFLGSDAGGKAASLEVMVRRHTLVPDIGYWAEPSDPAGTLHPLVLTSHVGDHWLNATTLPMLVASYPLAAAWGARGALLLPMLGAVCTALGARRLVRLLGGSPARADLGFWVIGLASPVTLYALQFWEHTLGLAAIVWAVNLLLRVQDAHRPMRLAFVAGALFGIAATMRTEALVYGLVATLVVLVTMCRAQQGFRHVVQTAIGALAGVIVPLVANEVLERAVLGSSVRAGRTAGTAGGAGSEFAGRAQDAFISTFSAVGATRQTVPILLGVVFVASIARAVWLAAASRVDAARVPALAAIAVALAAGVAARGPGFVPGLFPTMPLAVGGLVALALVRDRASTVRTVGVIAVAALPLVWLLQYRGHMIPQWSGRYVLTTGVLLLAVAIAALPARPRLVLAGLTVLSIAVTSFGFVWTVQRTRTVAQTAALLATRPEPVLIATDANLFRETGAASVDRRWLHASTRAQLDDAFAIAVTAGAHEVGVVHEPTENITAPAGWAATGDARVPYLGDPLVLTTYRLSGAP
jgi:hypothetical protein